MTSPTSGLGMSDSYLDEDIAEIAATVRLVDHHCHGVLRHDVGRGEFELLATESDWPPPRGRSVFDSQFGVVLRAECAPLLGLQRHAAGRDYLARRSELGIDDVNRRLLHATGIDTFVIETGFRSDAVLTPIEMAESGGAKAVEVARLERLAEEAAAESDVSSFLTRLSASLDRASSSAVAFKTIIAYRYGLDFDPDRPASAEVRHAAGAWLARTHETGCRLDDAVLLRHLLWEAVDRGKPLQVHVGYGDSDIELHRCDPTKMTEFIRRTRTTGSTVLLLHCYPFQREAGFLAQVYPHVFMDTGAAVNYTGLASVHVVREALELAPFHKVLFSSDAFGLPELYLCGALLWRRAVAALFGGWVAADRMSRGDATRYIRMIARDNADLAYGRTW